MDIICERCQGAFVIELVPYQRLEGKEHIFKCPFCNFNCDIRKEKE